MKELTLREIQLRELNLLLKFSSFCEEHELRYSLCSGTLLGAIRHKGFIPWDDDIDVQMPRPDYDKFISLIKRKKELSVAGYGVSSKCQLEDAPFIRVQDVDTKIEMTYLSYQENNHLWMDILPLDGFPESSVERRQIEKQIKKYKRNLGWANVKIGTGKTVAHSLLKLPAVIICKQIGTDYFGKKWSDLGRKYKYNEYNDLAVIGGNYYGSKEYVEKELWLDRKRVEFEGYSFWIMGCWKEHLTRLYGDYMTMPPIEQRKAHHSFTVYLNH